VTEHGKRRAWQEGSLVEKFIRDENIKLYRSALAECSDEDKRRVLLVLLQLLVVEEAASRPKQSPADIPTIL
jgi:hypothetical protein